MQFTALLNLLSDGKFYSGEFLGLELGMSRTAVWKQLQKMRSMGVRVDAVHGKGYRLREHIDLLRIEKIQKNLSDEAKKILDSIEIHDLLESTNTYLMNDATNRVLVCLAEYQFAGRGRRGRRWISPYGQNIYLSTSCFFEEGVSQLDGLSLVIALALCEALEEQGIYGVQLKWPNDLIFDNRKLAGILLEMKGDAGGFCKVVIGVGLNVNMTSDISEIDQPWINLRDIVGKNISRNNISSSVINHLIIAIDNFKKYGFSFFKENWIKRDIFFNKNIQLTTSSTSIEGIGRGVNNHGALLLETSDGIKSFYGGEISARSI